MAIVLTAGNDLEYEMLSGLATRAFLGPLHQVSFVFFVLSPNFFLSTHGFCFFVFLFFFGGVYIKFYTCPSLSTPHNKMQPGCNASNSTRKFIRI